MFYRRKNNFRVRDLYSGENRASMKNITPQHTYEYHPVGKILDGPRSKIDYVYGFAYKKLLYSSQTAYQKIEVYDTALFGKLLKLDDFFQTSEKEEFFYHELMVHPAMCSHSNPEKILIIGGGDGGILKNVLYHQNVKKAVLVEIDGEVVRASKKYLPSVSGNAFGDKRTQLIIRDGNRFIKETKEKFDVIIADLTDPLGPSKNLYGKNFYDQISNLLNKRGIFQLHTEFCVTRPELSRQIYENLKSCFKYAAPYAYYIPLYGGLMGFSTNSDYTDASKIKAEVIEKRLRERKVKNLRLYNGQFHEALFTLPNFLKKLYSVKI